jgi:hypothetical protein
MIGKDKELFQSSLKGRCQWVLINNKTTHSSTVSNWALVKHGVPQGFILGPVLFLLYINDLPQIINERAIPILFTDDTNILFTHHNTTKLHASILIVLENINTWFLKLIVPYMINMLTTQKFNFHALVYFHSDAFRSKRRPFSGSIYCWINRFPVVRSCLVLC